jgi:EAL and modified HD-GYP domain-containing signal transduction protein
MSDKTYLDRQPILDPRQEVVGYELTLQAGREETAGHSALLVCAASAELGVRIALGRRKAFLRVDSEFLHDDAIEALPANGVVLQLALDAAPGGETLERCRMLRERGYSLAFADYTGLDARSSPLLTLVDFIKIDVHGKDAQQLQALAGPLARLPLKLLAQRIETPEDFALGRDSGFQLFQGHFLARPEAVSRRLTISRNVLLRLVDLAARDTDSARIEESIKHNPALAVNLLSIVDSSAHGFSRRIGSLSQALQVLGGRQLRRWLRLLLAAPDGTAPEADCAPLLQVAALRARMLEMLAARLRLGDPALADQAFITGLMSMMPAVLDRPMDELLELITLEREIVAALQSREGLLGEMLALIECYDGEDAEGCDRILAGAGLDRNLLNTCLIESLRWIDAGEETQARN